MCRGTRDSELLTCAGRVFDPLPDHGGLGQKPCKLDISHGLFLRAYLIAWRGD